MKKYPTMFGLADGNNFFVSCERVFQPSLCGKPVVVLSSNDGCVIARSNEAKVLGIKMGVPVLHVKDIIWKYGVKVFSTNLELYGDMSERMIYFLYSMVSEVDVYSIDEAFLNLSSYQHLDLREYGLEIVRKTSRGTGLPISLGIAPTKTLAKIANYFAKRYAGYKSVCVIDSEEKRIKALQLVPIDKVWGVGRQHFKFLQHYNVKTAYDFSLLPRNWVRGHMTVVGERMWCELQGEACIEMELVPLPKKQICNSGSFGEDVTNLEGLKAAVATFADRGAVKLRKQGSCASVMSVFIHTNRFKENFYFRHFINPLPVATNSSLVIVKTAIRFLKEIYQKGYSYKKAGVILSGLSSEGSVQLDMFDGYDYSKHTQLMKQVDCLNRKGRSLVSLAVKGDADCKFHYKQEHRSNRYTTNVKELLRIKC